jgi:hypothetical protein
MWPIWDAAQDSLHGIKARKFVGVNIVEPPDDLGDHFGLTDVPLSDVTSPVAILPNHLVYLH